VLEAPGSEESNDVFFVDEALSDDSYGKGAEDVLKLDENGSGPLEVGVEEATSPVHEKR
jgi:hypothetical protein